MKGNLIYWGLVLITLLVIAGIIRWLPEAQLLRIGIVIVAAMSMGAALHQFRNNYGPWR